MSGPLRVRCDAVAGTLRVQVQKTFLAPWTVLFGASGSGKTSLLRVIAGLWRPAGCSVVLGERELAGEPAHRRHVALVAQYPALFPNRTVRGNVAFAARGGAESSAVVDEMLERFRLGPLATRPVRHLSGGEAQRVCLARAMATLPRVLLLDESFSGLHRELRDELVEVLRHVQSRRDLPIVSVTHDAGEAFLCADEVVRMDAGQVVQSGTAAEILAVERMDVLRQMGLATG